MATQSAKHFLGKPITKEYIPTIYYGMWMTMRRAPRFTLSQITAMMQDPRVVFGLWLIKGPILAKSRFFVDCENTEVKDFLKRNLTRFWRSSAARALQAIEWGFSASEVLYKVEDEKVVFDKLKNLHPMDCRALTIEGQLVGASVKNVPSARTHHKRKIQITGPRCFWHVNNRDFHPYYGRSRLYGAYLPWLEIWTDGGFRDSRRLYFHKYAYFGPVIYHPPGVTRIQDENGNVVAMQRNKDMAREMGEKYKTGGTLAIPNTGWDSPGGYQWKVEWPTVNSPPTNVMEYGHDLKDEMWEGMGIPPEVARAEGTGAYAGRRVPMEAFYAILQEVVHWLLDDVDSQLLQPLVDLNFGKVRYEIVPFGLLTPSMEEKEAEQNQQPMPGQPPQEQQFSQQVDNQPLYDPVLSSPPEGYEVHYG